MDSVFGLGEKALVLCEKRAKLISDNIANSSTPHYKAKDIDFQKILSGVAEKSNSIPLRGSQRGLLGVSDSDSDSDAVPVMYRVPMQEGLDGNTVDQEIERKNFIENSVRYEISLTLVHNRTKELLEAIKGE